MEHEDLIRDLARDALDHLEPIPAHPATYRVRDEAPVWVSQLFRHAHTGLMCPEVWRANALVEVLDAISDDTADLDDLAYESDWSIDMYSQDLIGWLGSHHRRKGWVDDALMSMGSIDDLDQAIMLGQEYEYREICELVLAWLAEFAEERAEELEEVEIDS